MRQLIIISGRSGSGKTVALHSLEDLGFYCIDNLPIDFLPALDQTLGGLHNNIAISMDTRNFQLEIHDFKKIFSNLAIFYDKIEIIYLDAHDDVLLQRFSDTRRKHPLIRTNSNFTLREAITKERVLLVTIANLANFILDTTKLSQHELYNFIRARINRTIKTDRLHLLLQSFGFKYGLPADADFVFDLRCLPNPYWDLKLRALTGLDLKVIEYLSANSVVQHMENKLLDFITEWLECFNKEHRSYVTVALGCTGGKHRSVYLAESIGKKLLSKKNLVLASVEIRHRELKV